MLWKIGIYALLLTTTTALASSQAAPGDPLGTVFLPHTSGVGYSVAADCVGRLYYTIGDEFLYKTDRSGTDLGSVRLIDENGAPAKVDEMSWDESRSRIWGVENTNVVGLYRVFLIDPATGNAVRQFDYTSNHPTVDGIAHDPYDDTIWIKGDGDPFVDHFTVGGSSLTRLQIVQNGQPVGGFSGVCVADGGILYLDRVTNGDIIRARKSDGEFIDVFATVGGHHEGVECDPVSFQPAVALWAREAFTNTLGAIEMPARACACSGSVPAQTSTWGNIKATFR